MSEMKSFLLDRAKHPFWSAFLFTYITINWKLVVLCIFEFEKMDLDTFIANLVGVKDSWILVPFLVGIINAVVGHSFKEFLNVISIYIFNNTQGIYIRLLEKRPIPEREHFAKLKELQDNIDRKERELAKLRNQEQQNKGYINTLIVDRDELREFKDDTDTFNQDLQKKLRKIQSLLDKTIAKSKHIDPLLEKELKNSSTELENILMELIATSTEVAKQGKYIRSATIDSIKESI